MESNNAKLENFKKSMIEWLKAILFATIIVVVVRWFLFTPTIVSGISMEPNYHDKERLIVNKIIYDFREPKRGEVIVFEAPEGLDFIKRVIGLPGDKVMVKGDEVYINDQLIHEPYIAKQIEAAKLLGRKYNSSLDFKVINQEVTAVTVPEGKLFVLGDNRPRSKDSRYDQVGFISIDEIKGRADLIFWPISEFKLIQTPKIEVEQ